MISAINRISRVHVFSYTLRESRGSDIYFLLFHSVHPVTNVSSDTRSSVSVYMSYLICGLHSLHYISYSFVPIFIDQSSHRLLVGVMVRFISGYVSTAGRMKWLLAPYFAL